MNTPLAAIQLAFGRERILLFLLLVPLFGFLSWRLTWRSKRLRRTVHFLRLAMLAMMIVALAEPMLARSGIASTTVILMDQSTSVTSNQESDVNTWLRSALVSSGASDNAAIVAFGGSADLVAPWDQPRRSTRTGQMAWTPRRSILLSPISNLRSR